MFIAKGKLRCTCVDLLRAVENKLNQAPPVYMYFVMHLGVG